MPQDLGPRSQVPSEWTLLLPRRSREKLCQLCLELPPILAAKCIALGSLELQEPLGTGFRLILTGIREHSAGNTDIKPL